jgi:hypothetical protein
MIECTSPVQTVSSRGVYVGPSGLWLASGPTFAQVKGTLSDACAEVAGVLQILCIVEGFVSP